MTGHESQQQRQNRLDSTLDLDSTISSNKFILEEVGSKLLELEKLDIDLIDLTSKNSVEKLRELFPDNRLYACDFPVVPHPIIENWSRIPGGYYQREKNVINIDHHAERYEMYRFVSSGVLASEYINKIGQISPEDHVVINHTDCDSVISSLILRGYLPPHKIFQEAVIAADHTGEENAISDLLQALDVKRDLRYSVRNLGLFLTNQVIEEEAQKLLEDRLSGREEVTRGIENDSALVKNGEVALVHLTGNMRNTFLPALLPNSALIVTYEDIREDRTWVARMRLGKAAPEKFNLFSLQANSTFDSNFGGRWNAGANKRGGGSSLPVKEYFSRVLEAYSNCQI